MRVLVPLALAVLALLDGCFSGFRGAAGRDARTDKRAYARRACLHGTVAGAAVLGVLTAVCAVLVPGRYAAFTTAGGRMLLVLVPYALLVLGALVAYSGSPRPAVQTLASTLVLGPFTLVRPLVVVAGVAAACSVEVPVVCATSVLSGVLVLLVEPLLRRLPPPDVPPTPPPWAVTTTAPTP